MKKIKVLDCTFRDGGYYNNWNFNKTTINNYINKINKSNVDVVEIGFRFLSKKIINGDFAYSSDDFVNKLVFDKKIDLAIMLNASEILKSNNYKKQFIKKKFSKIKIIRIACHINEINKIKSHVFFFKQLGYKLIINIMQISKLSADDIMSFVKKIDYLKSLEALYFADSIGSMKPNDVKRIYSKLSKKINTPLGIHAHNNKGYALQNTLIALKNGAIWLDSTILGMGRGAGNTETEILLAELKAIGFKKYNPQPLFELSQNNFAELKKKYNWGNSVYYYICADKNIHPTYLQTILSDKSVKPEKVFQILNRLGKIDSSSYDKEYLESLLTKSQYKKNSLKNWCKNSEILLLGNGPSLKNNKKTIIELIKTNKLKVLSLNINKVISEKYINYYVASYIDRILIDLPSYNDLKKPLIIPSDIFSWAVHGKKNTINTIFYEIDKIVDDFYIKQDYCRVPNFLAFTYALAISKLGSASKIYLAGFDGYEVMFDSRNSEMLNTINIFQKSRKNPQISFITGSKYQI
tara:strand:+ start:21336 stop:22901 length:1566 start_codon:yes stop_codon:yes gene_type:complete